MNILSILYWFFFFFKGVTDHSHACCNTVNQQKQGQIGVKVMYTQKQHGNFQFTSFRYLEWYILLLIIIIIIIIFAFKGAVQNFLQSPRCAANCLQHVHSRSQGTTACKSRATQQALITCSVSCATWYEGTAQLLSLTELKLHLL